VRWFETAMTRDKKPPEPPVEDYENDSPFGEPVVVPIEDRLDLHPFSPKDIPSVVEEYLAECAAKGFSEVRLIHGKGIGMQRNIVRSILSKHPEVASYRDAPAEAGGWGATLVILKTKS
jgi:DNA-nicking Smr family endonuclease